MRLLYSRYIIGKASEPLKKTILVSFLVASTLFFAMPTAQSQGLNGVSFYSELTTSSAGKPVTYGVAVDFVQFFRRTFPPDPGWLECKDRIGGADYTLRFESTKAREAAYYFFYTIDQSYRGKHWTRNGRLSVDKVGGDRLYEILKLRGGPPDFTFLVWATTDNKKIPLIYDKNYFDFSCRNQ